MAPAHTLVVRFEYLTGRTQVCCPCVPRRADDRRGEALQDFGNWTWGEMLSAFMAHLPARPAPQSRFADQPRRQPLGSSPSGSRGYARQ